jgi:REP element-mobilizing transposase RayT
MSDHARSSFPRRDWSVFDPQRDIRVDERRLPHWSQSETVCFITWRTWDSLPRNVVESLVAERDALLARHGIADDSEAWREQLRRQSPALAREVFRHLSSRWESAMDACHGACVLRRPEFAKIVADSLLHREGVDYDMHDFVVMPNHVHVLAAFIDDDLMLKQCESWKRFMAVRMNKLLGRQGRFWQQDAFDHLVRSEAQYEYLRRYIAENPVRTRLRKGEYLHYSRAVAANG